jgi:hypothetical protein
MGIAYSYCLVTKLSELLGRRALPLALSKNDRKIDFVQLADDALNNGHTEVGQLLFRMQGIQLDVPNLWFTFSDWPHGTVNPGYSRLAPLVDLMLDE